MSSKKESARPGRQDGQSLCEVVQVLLRERERILARKDLYSAWQVGEFGGNELLDCSGVYVSSPVL